MSSYSYLKNGDILPMVSILQLLLNRQIEGKIIGVDGVFGPKTRKAVSDFQHLRHIPKKGIVDRRTWLRLIEGTGLKIIDSVDVTEEWLDNPEMTLDPFRAIGANPIVVGAMCNGVSEAVRQIVQRVGNGSNLLLLRFHGHGAAGIQGVTDGTGEFENKRGEKVNVYSDELSSIASDNLKNLLPDLKKLRTVFGIYTCVEMHGCKVAKGQKGRNFIKILANRWEVPVSAGIIDQLGGLKSAFRFEGRVFTAFPHGKNFKTWSAGLPRFAGVCLP